MNGSRAQNLIYSGYAKAAKRLGFASDVYRPMTASNPIASGTKIYSGIPASFNAEDMSYTKPRGYAKATWFGLFDGRLTQVGDYLVSAKDGTFFIAAQQSELPILTVKCTNTVTIKSPQSMSGVGALSYGGTTASNQSTLMTAWPCSILQGSKGEKSDAILPGDSRSSWWIILLPYFTGVTLRMADIITDDLARKFTISSAELTALGWRLTAAQAQT